MYLVGLLFGLGFDTATEIGLLVLAGSAVAGSIPWWAVLTLPVLFAAGMSLLDSAQGLMARRAYRFMTGRRTTNRTYSVVMTILSVVVAVIVGSTELAHISTATFHLGGIVAFVGGLGIEWLGFLLTGVILAVWTVSFALSRRRHPLVP
ncbi:hypothetical protein AX769_21635 (plasmid) [Frondihabitans sp. PAMC 28766]|nr:hypothetical protein AX769_21635 [Frondihabitans sp. PAMC 28766]